MGIISASLYKSILSGLTHVLFIASLEIVLYFIYLVKLEKEGALSLIENLGDDVIDYCKENSGKKSIPIPIPINSEDYDILKKNVEYMKANLDEENKELDKKNNKLIITGVIIIAVMIVILILSMILLVPSGHKILNWNMWKDILKDVAISLVFVIIFELILINFIIMKYQIVSGYEAKFSIVKSLFNSRGVCYNVSPI